MARLLLVRNRGAGLMYDARITTETTLDVAYHPVQIVFLSPDGLLPAQVESQSPVEPKLQQFRELPPSNLTENTLMSIWLNTHQAMFISTGLAAHCVFVATQLIEDEADLEEVKQYLKLACDARLASAAYTSLPHLTRELYEVYIRESMKLVHPGFSGVSNQESVSMEKKLHDLKQVQRSLQVSNKSAAEALSFWFDELYQADRTWWRFHGQAMNKYVTTPVSLARMDFAKRKDNADDFEEYRTRVLRDDKVQADYDRYFAVERRDNLSIDDYRVQLAECLLRSEPYVDPQGDLAEHRAAGKSALFQLLDIEAARLSR